MCQRHGAGAARYWWPKCFTLHNHDHRQPTLLPSPLTPSSSLPWFADTLKKLDFVGQSNFFLQLLVVHHPHFCLCHHAYGDRQISVCCSLQRILACFRCLICICNLHATIIGRKRGKIGSGQNVVCPNQCMLLNGICKVEPN